MSDDEWKKAEADVQKITDSYIARAQDLMKKKEEEVLEIQHVNIWDDMLAQIQQFSSSPHRTS